MAVALRTVQAAGGVVVREDGRVCLIRRTRDGTWTLPKGKLQPGESFREAALREVHEETGLRCEISGPLLARQRTVDRRGRDKAVRWWPMRVVRDDGFRPGDEVDRVRWATPVQARELLSCAHDRGLVAAVSG